MNIAQPYGIGPVAQADGDNEPVHATLCTYSVASVPAKVELSAELLRAYLSRNPDSFVRNGYLVRVSYQ